MLNKFWMKFSVYKLIGIMQLCLGLGIWSRPKVGTFGEIFSEDFTAIYFFVGMFLAGGVLLLVGKPNPIMLLVGTFPFAMYALLTAWAAFVYSPQALPLQAPIIYVVLWILIQMYVARGNGHNG
jgi:hypothetical protein